MNPEIFRAYATYLESAQMLEREWEHFNGLPAYDKHVLTTRGQAPLCPSPIEPFETFMERHNLFLSFRELAGKVHKLANMFQNTLPHTEEVRQDFDKHSAEVKAILDEICSKSEDFLL